MSGAATAAMARPSVDKARQEPNRSMTMPSPSHWLPAKAAMLDRCPSIASHRCVVVAATAGNRRNKSAALGVQTAEAAWSTFMRDDLPLMISLAGGLFSAVGAAVLITTPVALPLLVIAGGAVGASIRELARER